MLFVALLAGTLVLGAVACPLWMSFFSQAEMPCPEHSKSPVQCPFLICQVGSPYLASHVDTAVPLFTTLPVQMIDLSVTPVIAALPLNVTSGAPPGRGDPVYLQIHSLLI